MGDAPKQTKVCEDCGRRYRDPATLRSGQCPRCQGKLVRFRRDPPLPELRRDGSGVKKNGNR